MVERRLIAIEGMVQGVGFRPFVYRLAAAHDLRGSVRNDAGGVLVDVEGEPEALESFVSGLTLAPPPSAVIESISAASAVPRQYGTLDITASAEAPERSALVLPDLATCNACVAELLNPRDRRYRYPFITCTDCGPRFTILNAVPFDRARTGMAGFPLCEACRREYENPADRRFHAQSIACPDCGPTLRFETTGSDGPAVTGETALASAAEALRRGAIVAVKGLGGYHLACDATSDRAVRRLRERKRRDAKPLAIMVHGLGDATRLCEVAPAESALLTSPERPIVLLARRVTNEVSGAVAPGTRYLGVMLPYTPVHHLLLEAVGRPLVMTSGNRSDEAIAYEDGDALTSLAGIADCFLLHDRPISTRCDDSVVRMMSGGASCIRRSRGWAPRPIRVASRFCVPVLALGAQLKSTFCLGKGRRAFLSPHVGDLECPDTFRALEIGVRHHLELFDVRPEIVAHDLHPDYLSTRLAEEMSGVDRVAVQHHHAHVAACMAEHGVTEPVLGVAFDGAGLGDDGAIWGGEFLAVGGAGYERVAHLGYVALPGGDRAAREPWRMAVAHLWAAYAGEVERLDIPFLPFAARPEWPLLRQMLIRRVQCPLTSSVGRLFDAVAALAGVRGESRFEGQAAMELEMAADPDTTRTYPVDISEAAGRLVIEPGPLIRAIVGDIVTGRPVAEIAGGFHNAVRDLIAHVAERVRGHTGLAKVALTGGVFQNRLLTERTASELSRRNFEVLLHRQVPCNDGGVSLGQAAVAGHIFRGGAPCA